MKRTKLDTGVMIQTEVGKIRIWSDRPDQLYAQSWHTSPVRIADRRLRFMLELRRDKDRWLVSKSYGPGEPGGHRGDAEKLTAAVLSAVEAWVPKNGRLMRAWALSWLKHMVASEMDRKAGPKVDNLREMIADATAIDRFDLLKPMRPLITRLASDFAQAAERIGERRRAAA